MIKKILYLAISALSVQAYAAGYRMEFQSVSILAGGGEAAAIEDAGTNWYNSAGNVYLPQQTVFSGIDVYAPSEFSGTVTAPSAFEPFIGPSSFDFKATGTATSYSNALIPAIHYVLPFHSNRYAFGISMVPSWGFKQDYGKDTVTRYNLVSVYTKTMDIAPSLSMKVNDQWSVGVGPDFNYFSLQTVTKVRTEGPTLPFPFPSGTPGDSTQRGTANQWKTGWHAGILYRLGEQTRFGLNYRSKIVMHNHGTSSFTLNNSVTFDTNEFEFTTPLPASTTLSVYQDVTDRWALTGTVQFDQWDTLQAYHAHGVVIPPTLIGGKSTLKTVDLDQNMKNAWNFSVGTHYKLNDLWMLRGSVKYIQTPTVDADRQIAFPDGPKLGFQIGSRYQMTKKLALDLIYGHVFVNQVPIHDVNPLTNAVADGHSRSHIDLVGAQVVMNI